MRSPFIPALGTAAILSLACAAQGQGPALIHYQGRLLDTAGTPVNGAVNVSVGLYTNAATGVPVFSQTIGSVTAINGMFDFAFGTNTLPFLAVFTNEAVWVGVTVDGDQLTPRQRLMSVPFALTASRVPDLTMSTAATAAGVEADGRDSGAAVGYQAKAYSAGSGLGGGAALGRAAEASDYGAAVGREAVGFSHGVAVGYQTLGFDNGTAIGNQAYAAATNVAVGAGAVADGVNRTALGPGVVSEANDSTTVRGSLYLDGAAGVFHRPTFGSGGWTAGWPGGWSGTVTNIAGIRTQLLYYASGVLTNSVFR